MANNTIESNINTIILSIPDNTVKLTVVAKVLDENEKLCEYQRTLNLDELIESRIEYEFWEYENDSQYVLTDKGKKDLEEREN